jgi:hypothetical protein
MSGILEKLRKIKEHAEHGVGGEKKNAQRILKKLLKKHGLKYDDVFEQEPERKKVWFTCLNKPHKLILFQCYRYIIQKSTIEYYNRSYSKIVFLLSTWEELELKQMYSYYKRLWNKTMNDVLDTFIYKHHLYSDEAVDDGPMNKGDKEKLIRMMELSRGMEDSKFLSTKRMLTDGG